MRRLSIQARVTLWYTGLLVLLLGAGTAYLLAFSSTLSQRQLRDALQDAVADAVQAARFRHGELEEEDIDFYRDGVSLFLYDTGGHLLAPRVNRGIQLDALLEDQVIKTVSGGTERWLVHDLYAQKDGVGFWVRGVASLSGTQGTLRKLLLLALVGVPAFVLVAALGGWQITRRAFAPVGEMAAAADAISSGSDLSRRIPEDRRTDELARLASTLNAMLGRLQSTFERERQFTGDVSHELRTPVAVILSQCEYALSPAAGESERRQALEAILRQDRRMGAIISQLLLLSRAEDGRFQPALERLDMSALCEMVALELEERARQSGVELRLQLEPGVLLTGDETLLMRLINNLLVNAIAYNRPGGSAVLRLRPEGTGCLLEVADTGIGIPEGEREKIWDRFYRADAARSGAGAGLGLSMARWIVLLHGGAIELESAVGVGSTFRVRLPQAPP